MIEEYVFIVVEVMINLFSYIVWAKKFQKKNNKSNKDSYLKSLLIFSSFGMRSRLIYYIKVSFSCHINPETTNSPRVLHRRANPEWNDESSISQKEGSMC